MLVLLVDRACLPPVVVEFDIAQLQFALQDLSEVLVDGTRDLTVVLVVVFERTLHEVRKA